MVEYIAQNLVDDPHQVEVIERPGMRTTVLKLRVAPDEMGKVIGKEGRVANAIRTLVRVSANRQGRRAIVEID
jgi:predicted RNA-binding protein YlqC (UPF0109 family)